MAGHSENFSDAKAGPRLPLEIVCATGNEHKLAEIRAILSDLPLKILSLSDFPGLELPQEDGKSYIDNALKKARFVFRETQKAAVADDTGLEVEVLNNAPGIFSQRYAPNDAARRKRLLEQLSGISLENRHARFCCTVGFVFEQGEYVFSGELAGLIALEEHGSGGFGYDSLFYLPSLGRTYAELTFEEKNSISHRAKALHRFRFWLTSNVLSG